MLNFTLNFKINFEQIGCLKGKQNYSQSDP